MVPSKANTILNIILFAIILILIRVWYLSVIQYDQKLEESQKPQKKTIIEPAIRATIRDRFNEPLAINKIGYQSTILYSQIRDIPSIVWEFDPNLGKKIKKFKRKEYIKALSEILGKELNLDALRIEDLIHGKASYYAQVPYVIKDNLSENEYYKLKGLEKDWPGIYTRKIPIRYYPKGRLAGDIIGYMGAINKKEYENILNEMQVLDQFINSDEDGELPFGITSKEQAMRKLKDLEEKAYTIHDYVGKTGVEGIFEKQLRGFYGKKKFYTDSKGHFLYELPGSRPPIAGQRILLTISSELQEYAEQLLTQNELLRIVRLSRLGIAKKTIISQKHPWIKGGAIIAMDPLNGEILALASYPRFNPNDFIGSSNNKEKSRNINRWFENETHIAHIWNQQHPFEREIFDEKFQDESLILTWSKYLDFILPEGSVLRKVMSEITTIEHAINIQKDVDAIRSHFFEENLYTILNNLYCDDFHIVYKEKLHREYDKDGVKPPKKRLDRYFNRLPQNYDKVLLVDLCRLAVNHETFSKELLTKVGKQSLNNYKTFCGNFVTLRNSVKEEAKKNFHTNDFAEWRKKEEKEFLKQKRLEEKRLKIYPKSYLDYLDQQEKIQFEDYWEKNKFKLILAAIHQNAELEKAIKDLSFDEAQNYLQTLRTYQDLNRPLFGKYRGLRNKKAPLEKHLAAAFYPVYGFGYGRSFAYRQSAIQGSIFKLITAYEALTQKYKKLKKTNLSINDLNPLVLIDQVFTQDQTIYVGYTKEGKPIPQQYKGGRVPRSLAHQNNGEVDLIKALEVSSNPYFSLLAGECLENPEDLAKAACSFSYGEKTGIDLPGEISGKVPTDLATNRTGLYAMAIGQHSLVVTPLQTAVMLCALANGGKILKPNIIKLMAGRQPHRIDQFSNYPEAFSYAESLAHIGIDFPLFTAISYQNQKNCVEKVLPKVKREIFMPQIIRYILLKGLKATVLRAHQESTWALTRLYKEYPEAIQSFTELKNELLGKSSTSESVETIDLDLNEGTNLYTHVWFGSIAFEQDKKAKAFIYKDEFGKPELVVVVYLRYGGYGKEAAPLAAQMVKKWRQIKENLN